MFETLHPDQAKRIVNELSVGSVEYIHVGTGRQYIEHVDFL